MKKLLNKIVNIFKDKDNEAKGMYNVCRDPSGVMRAFCDIETQNH
jgi:hypothetical protein